MRVEAYYKGGINRSGRGRRMSFRLLSRAAAVGLLSCVDALAQTQTSNSPPPPPIAELSLEQLAEVQVTTVGREPIKSMKAPAAVYVITQEDIRRSGSTSIPEALRLAPGVQVERITSSQWAIGVRGFGSRLSRSLLVMIDGRNVYSPLFAGTYWEVQDTLLEDVDRIEVILGPGGTLWGANAVNGIINVITKSTAETPGTIVTTGTGTVESGFVGVRHGGRLSDATNYRAFGKFFQRSGFPVVGRSSSDAWQTGRAGFRIDSSAEDGRSLTIQGDLYRGLAGQRTAVTTYTAPYSQAIEGDAELSGGNLLSRLTRRTGEHGEIAVQVYYDRTRRAEPTFREIRDTVDIDLQHRVPALGRQDLIWGVGYRLSSGDAHGVSTIGFTPPRRTDQLASAFLQSTVRLVPNRLEVIAGSKIEHNSYSGVVVQPSGRVLWTPSTTQTLFGAVTRAVRTPSRIEHDIDLTSLFEPTRPIFVRTQSNDSFQPEILRAYEVGYRNMPSAILHLSATGFFNQHRRLLSTEALGAALEDIGGIRAIVVPFAIANGTEGSSTGFELTADTRVAPWWRLHGAYSRLHLNLTKRDDSTDTRTAPALEAGSPPHQVAFRSTVNLPARVEVDWMARVIAGPRTTNANRTNGYGTWDLRLGWTPTPAVQLSIVGQNLQQRRHRELISRGDVIEIPRSVYASVTWRR